MTSKKAMAAKRGREYARNVERIAENRETLAQRLADREARLEYLARQSVGMQFTLAEIFGAYNVQAQG